MPRIFLSHQRKNSREAVALRNWLLEVRRELANEIFLDLDPQDGMKVGGPAWKRQLVRKEFGSETVVCLLSKAWLASGECVAEFRNAQAWDKQIIIARLEDLGDTDITSEMQRCDLFVDGLDEHAIEEIHLTPDPPAVPDGPPVRFRKAALAQIQQAIQGSGIGPENFGWPPSDDRAPYRGWGDPFEDIDAGVYFGRDAAIRAGVHELHEMRCWPSRRKWLFVVLSPSGRGKSSFLRAGLVPRLQRDVNNFVVLGVMRPENNALTGDHGFAAAVDSARRALKLPGPPLGEIQAQIEEACQQNDDDQLYAVFHKLLSQVRAEGAQRIADSPPDGNAAANRGAETDEDRTATKQPTDLTGGSGNNNETDKPAEPAHDAGQPGETSTERPAGEGEQNSSAPTLVLPLDQAEELFPAGSGTGAQHFLAVIAKLLVAFNATEIGLIVAATIRTDRYDDMQGDPALGGVGTVPFSELTPMSATQVEQVITGPAKRETEDAGRRLDIDPSLVTELVKDAEGADTLPLLSLTLQRLYKGFASKGELTLAHYETMGRIWQVVNNEINQILPADPQERETALARLRSAFIPNLVKITETGRFVRRRAPESDLPEDSRPLIKALVERRLLVSDRERDGHVVLEVSLESLFDHWDDLKRWLAEHTEDLKTVADVDRSSAGWKTYDRDPYWLLAGTRLGNAERVSRTAQFRRRLAEAGDFLAASRQAEDKTIAAERKRRRILTVALAITMIVAIVAFVAAGTAYWAYRTATAERVAAEALGMLNRDRPGNDVRAIQEMLAANALSSGTTADDTVAAAIKLSSASKLITPPGRIETAAAYSPDGTRIASGGLDHKLLLWDADTGEVQGEPVGDDTVSGKITSVAFSPDNRSVLSSSDNGELRMWDAQTHRRLPQMANATDGSGKPAAIFSVAFSSDGKYIATVGSSNDVQLWNPQTLAPLRTLPGHTDTVTSVAFSPKMSNPLLASASLDGTVRLWNADTGEQLGDPLKGLTGLPVPQPPLDSFLSVGFSPDGQRLIAGSYLGTVWKWDGVDGDGVHTPQGQELKDPTYPHSVHTAPVRSVAFANSGNTLASGSIDGTIRWWDWDSGQSITLPSTRRGDSVETVAFRPNTESGAELLSCTSAGGIQLWNPRVLRLALGLTGHGGTVTNVAFSPDRRHIASGGYQDKTVQVWDLETGGRAYDPRPVGGDVTGLAYSPDGSRIVASSSDGKVHLWDSANGQPSGPGVIKAPAPVYTVAYSPNRADPRIVSGGADRDLHMWNPDTGASMGALTGHDRAVETVAFSPPYGQLIASGSDDTTIRIWSVADGKQVGDALRGHTGKVVSVAFSPDGNRLVSGSLDGTVRLWDVNSHKQITTPLAGHAGDVEVVAFSPKGHYIVSGSNDGTVRLWNADTGHAVGAPLVADSMRVDALAFNSDGSELVSAGRDYEHGNNWLHLWTFPVDESDARSTLCDKISSNMSEAQWHQWISQSPFLFYQPQCADKHH